MDNVHRPDEREEISEKVHLKSYFQKFSETVAKARPENVVDYRRMSRKRVKMLVEGKTWDCDDFLEVNWQLDDKTFNKVEGMCNIDNLTIEGECPPVKVILDDDESSSVTADVKKFEVVPIDEEAKKKLKTLQYLDKTSDDETRKRILKLRNFNDIWFEAAPKPPRKIKPEVIEKEMLVTVRVYRPLKNNPRQPTSSFRYSQEILLLGGNTLTELRDFIKCPADFMIPDDVSENPFATVVNPVTGRSENCWDSKKKNKDIYKSGFFCIEGCFYNDMRWPECHDYSEVIREWASHPKRQMGPFETAKMEETTIESLTIRLGYPYVYVHQGDHEHLVVFLDARLLTADDPQLIRSYPMERSIGLTHSKYCIVCCNRVAKWITASNERVPEDPFFFCAECFKDYNYSGDGTKKGKFRAFNYIEPNAL